MPHTRSAAFAVMLLDSHARLTGGPLCEPHWSSDEEAAEWLYSKAPFGLLAHDTADDPRFVYANQTAQHCFGYSWDEFQGMPSRLSAAEDRQAGRNAFLESVERDGYATGYRGPRLDRDGREFWIEDVTMWDLVDVSGRRHGQAAVFHSWTSSHRP